MKLDKMNIQEYRLADWSGDNDVITPEELQRIISAEKCDNPIRHTHTYDESKFIQKQSKTQSEVSDTSKSFIIVTCNEKMNPWLNRLQLRTDPPTYIELQPGKNILTVEKYPALKFGFRQIDEEDDDEDSVLPGENCQDVIEIDLSHFDGSEMVSMDYMFHFMSGIEKLTFGNMKTPKLKSAEWAFWGIGNCNNGEPNLDIDLTGLNFSKVTNARNMFSDASIRKLGLSGCNFENIMGYDANLFSESCIKHLILDNCKFRNVDVWNVWSDYRGLMEVSLKGWKKDDIREFIITMEQGRSKFIDFFPTAKYILDLIYEYHIGKDSDQNITCEIIIRSLGMDNSSKKEAMHEWITSNPGKTERDWLLEVRCMDDIQREDLHRLFSWADTNSIIIKVCPTVGSFKDPNGSTYREVWEWNDPNEGEFWNEIMGEGAILYPIIYVEADFQIVGNKDLYYDLDAPDYVFEQSKPDLYLNWKAEQMGIDPILTHTEYEIYEAFKPYMGANILHWENLITH